MAKSISTAGEVGSSTTPLPNERLDGLRRPRLSFEEVTTNLFLSDVVEAPAPLQALPGVTPDSGMPSRIAVEAKERLEKIFHWTPKEQFQSNSGSRSDRTREPAFYDLHLHEGLRLKQVIVVDDLAEKIAGICDSENLDSLLPTSLESNKGFPKVHAKPRRQNKVGRNVDETSVREAYQANAGKFCPKVASGLIFDLKDWKKVLSWSPSSIYKQSRAQADGFLVVDDPLDLEDTILEAPDTNNLDLAGAEEVTDTEAKKGFSWSDLTEADRKNIESIKRHKLDHIAIWEMKSLAAGSEKVMNAILDLKGEFKWTTCETNHAACGPSKHINAGGKRSISGRKTGPDSTVNFWKHELLDPKQLGKRKQREGEPHSTDGSGSSSSFVTDSVGSESVKTKAHWIIQQGWAELIANDATIIIFHSGNYEIIGIRHRASQTLSLSRCLHIPTEESPTHGKLHTACFIAAYHDAVNRAQQLDKWLAEPLENLPETYRRSYDYDQTEYPTPKPKISTAETKARKSVKLERDWAILDDLSQVSYVYIHLAPPIFAKCTRVLFDRQCDEFVNMSQQPVPPSPLHIFPRKKSSSSSRNLFRLLVQRDESDNAQSVRSVVMKMARSSAEREGLHKEYLHYLQVSETKVVPSTYGFFKYKAADEISSIDVLLLEDRGQSLDECFQYNPKLYALACKNFDFIKDTLRELHAAKMAHRNLKPDHILVVRTKDEAHPIFISLISLRECTTLEQPEPEHAVVTMSSSEPISDEDLSGSRSSANRQMQEDINDLRRCFMRSEPGSSSKIQKVDTFDLPVRRSGSSGFSGLQSFIYCADSETDSARDEDGELEWT